MGLLHSSTIGSWTGILLVWGGVGEPSFPATIPSHCTNFNPFPLLQSLLFRPYPPPRSIHPVTRSPLRRAQFSSLSLLANEPPIVARTFPYTRVFMTSRPRVRVTSSIPFSAYRDSMWTSAALTIFSGALEMFGRDRREPNGC